MRPDERKPRIYLHPDGLVLSIGFTHTNDTLLRLGGGDAARYDPEVDRDRGDMKRLRDWVAAVEALLSTPDPGEDRVEVVAEWLCLKKHARAGRPKVGQPSQLDRVEARDLLALLDPAPTPEDEIEHGNCPNCGHPVERRRVKAVVTLGDPAPTDQDDADASGGGESKGGQESVAPYSGSAVSAKPIATSAGVSADRGAEGSGGKCACGYIHFLCKRFTQAGCPDTETTEGLVRDPKLTREEAGALIADADYGFRWLPAEHFGHVGSARAKLSAALATEGEGDA